MCKYLYCGIIANNVIACYNDAQGYHYQLIGPCGIYNTIICTEYYDAKTAFDTLFDEPE